MLKKFKHLRRSIKKLPFPKSSGSEWTTTARPMMEFVPERGIYKQIGIIKKRGATIQRNIL